MKKILFVFLSLALMSCDAQNLKSVLGKVPNPVSKPSQLSNEEITKGLKEALEIGAKQAVNFTSKADGFLKNPEIRIPFPSEAERARTWAMNNGFSNQVTQFETSINRAAEKAAAEATVIFIDAIKGMTVQDGINILKGDSIAATTFLKNNTQQALISRFSPIIEAKIKDVNATAYWEPITKGYNATTTFTGKEPVNTDLTAYVTQKALDGLFLYVSKEEKKIRKDPAARVTEILQKVFAQQ